MDALVLDRVSKTFGDFYAVRDLSLRIAEGEIFGLLGPNGAGKTTTIRMIMRIILPDSGSVHIFGRSNSLEVLRQVGYLPEERGLYRKMKVRDVLNFFGELRGMSPAERNQASSLWLERLDLSSWQNHKVEELSRGMQQKLQFIITVMHRPRLVILDEPFTGLDPVNTALLKDIILELHRDGTTVIFSTHLMEQVEKMCESICLINKGQSVLMGPLQEIKAKFGKNSVIMQYHGDADFLSEDGLVERYDDYGNYVEVFLRRGADPQELLRRALKANVKILRFEVTEPSLNDIFIETVKGE